MPQFGTVTNLVDGSILLEPGPKTGTIGIFWFVQNQDIAPLKVSFPEYPSLGNIILRAGSAQGDAGGYIDSNGFPPVGKVLLESTIDEAQFGAGSTAGS
jgi:hypothetical protein